MKKEDLAAKSMAELRTLAKKAGIAPKSSWKKADFIKALSAKKGLQKKTAKAAKAAKKPAAKKTGTKRATTKRTKAAPKATPKAKAPKKAAKKILATRSPKAARTPLEALTVAELKGLAKELGIALGSGLKKADIIKALGKATTGKKKAAPKRAKKATAKPVPETPERAIKSAERAAPVKKRTPKAAGIPEQPAALPEEYGVDKVVTMPVTPRRLYIYWEITAGTLGRYRGNLNLKVIDAETGEAFYLPISERVDEYFITVRPGKEYMAEVGVIDTKGDFITLSSSHPKPAYVPKTAVPETELFPAAAGEAVEPPSSRWVRASETVRRIAALEEVAEAPELSEEFFEVPAFISSAESGRHHRKMHEAGGLPEEYFEMPEFISSY
ncbi:MAG: DUF4912 domain-containing protein [Nitrospirota bacterium]